MAYGDDEAELEERRRDLARRGLTIYTGRESFLGGLTYHAIVDVLRRIGLDAEAVITRYLPEEDYGAGRGYPDLWVRPEHHFLLETIDAWLSLVAHPTWHTWKDYARVESLVLHLGITKLLPESSILRPAYDLGGAKAAAELAHKTVLHGLYDTIIYDTIIETVKNADKSPESV